MPTASGRYDFVVVANRLPVDRVEQPDGSTAWRQSPGGLVTALEPVMRRADGAWVGWTGAAGEHLDPFDEGGMRLVPVELSADEVTDFYEGFSNGTLWPLYHDVIVAPEYHRDWWEAYVRVNERFARATAEQADEGATVWVQDYQLQLVPAVLRRLRPDLRIGFFNHIPFPPYEIFAQLPWRRQVVEGLLGADLLGFQRTQDANNFLRACRRAVGLTSRAHTLDVPDGEDGRRRRVHARAFPISIDAGSLDELARSEETAERVRSLREELGNPRKVVLGVDRLDYTKGIRHRLKAWGELLEDGVVDPTESVLVQVATPSRERVEQYKQLRDEIELTVGRINGDHSTIGQPAVHYLHHSYPRDEMAALFQIADVLLVTSLRDGMNLVAKEYVAARHDERGVLVLSEFTGAADEMPQALLVNPHDIEGLKESVCRALAMPAKEQGRRMRALRRRVREHDVTRWAQDFLRYLQDPPVPRGGSAQGPRESTSDSSGSHEASVQQQRDAANEPSS
ncbi:alpha,alpha-trehalose-phosphate synthase (UDP-forming) [Thalassiella azotivora]